MKNLFFILLLVFLKGNLFAQKKESKLKALARSSYWSIPSSNEYRNVLPYNIYKNNRPYGKNVTTTRDLFYDTVTILFVNENGVSEKIKVNYSAFTENLKFKYNGSVYRIAY